MFARVLCYLVLQLGLTYVCVSYLLGINYLLCLNAMQITTLSILDHLKLVSAANTFKNS